MMRAITNLWGYTNGFIQFIDLPYMLQPSTTMLQRSREFIRPSLHQQDAPLPVQEQWPFINALLPRPGVLWFSHLSGTQVAMSRRKVFTKIPSTGVSDFMPIYANILRLGLQSPSPF